MASESDLIADMLERVRREARGRIGDRALREVEAQAREAWGGRRVYINTGRRRKPRAAPLQVDQFEQPEPHLVGRR